jgi:hypothetical protein
MAIDSRVLQSNEFLEEMSNYQLLKVSPACVLVVAVRVVLSPAEKDAHVPLLHSYNAVN